MKKLLIEKKSGVETITKIVTEQVDTDCISTMHQVICLPIYGNVEKEYDVPYEESVPIYADAGKDTIRLTHDIKLSDITFEKVEEALKITIANDESTITIQKWYSDFSKIEILELGGVMHSLEELVSTA